MSFEGFPGTTFEFLRGIAKHNDKKWFDAHREDYDAGYVEPAKAFVSSLGPQLRKISKTVSYEPKVNGSLFRINRDIRFSKDKSPYKTHLDMWFWEGEKRGWGSPGFFFRMFPHVLMIGSGMHGFEKDSMARFREAVLDDRSGKALEKAIAEVEKSGCCEVGAPSRKTIPRGFDADHPRAHLLLHEGLFAHWEGKVPKEAKTAQFPAWCAKHYAHCAPISRWLLAHVAK
jgi:uncharacterized protein (TIGR02453 family)